MRCAFSYPSKGSAPVPVLFPTVSVPEPFLRKSPERGKEPRCRPERHGGPPRQPKGAELVFPEGLIDLQRLIIYFEAGIDFKGKMSGHNLVSTTTARGGGL